MISVRGLAKSFTTKGKTVAAVCGVSFEVSQGGFYVLLGASGSGKTTTMRCIAALERPDDGEIFIDGEPVSSAARGVFVPPEDRPVAMVFQSYALWPHMDVYKNIAFPLAHGRRRVPRKEIPRRVEKILEILQLRELIHRPVTALSGGQQQRVALARALALEPKVLLMDEPLSNLDARLRRQLRVELRDLTRRLGITTIYVTHDQQEALVMGDRIAVMTEGRIVQEGTPWDLYRDPKHLFVAQFLGEMNFIPGVVERVEGETALVGTRIGRLRATGSCPLANGQAVQIGVRVEDVKLARGEPENRLGGVIRDRLFLGEVSAYRVEVNGHDLQMKLSLQEQLDPGLQVEIHLSPASCRAFPADPVAGPGVTG